MQEKRALLEALCVPTIHLNGSDPAQLTDSLVEAYRALTEACRALNACAPHGRDYYPQGPRVTGKACAQHMARGQKLCDVMDELRVILDSVYDQLTASHGQ